jgi:hypothetical protein
MSKMDDLRAMREARYQEAGARTSTTAAARTAARPPTPVQDTAPRRSADDATPEERLCGHRAISGRTCTREQGHAAKSHRYS